MSYHVNRNTHFVCLLGEKSAGVFVLYELEAPTDFCVTDV